MIKLMQKSLIILLFWKFPAFALDEEQNNFKQMVSSFTETMSDKSGRKELTLTGTALDGQKIYAFIEALKTSSALTFLKLDNCSNITPSAVRAFAEVLRNNVTLTSLTINHSALGDSEFAAFVEALKYNNTLTSLSLCSYKNPCFLITKNIINFLEFNRHFKEDNAYLEVLVCFYTLETMDCGLPLEIQELIAKDYLFEEKLKYFCTQ